MKGKRIAVLLLVFGLVIALEVVMMSRCTRDESAALPTASAAPSDAPEQSGTTPVLPAAATALPEAPGYTSPPGATLPTRPPEDTQAPAPTRAPTQAPAPTKAPTQAPAPTAPPTDAPVGSVGSTVSSGHFSSNTGTSLNLSVSWKATELGNGKVRITIDGTVNSYSVQAAALPVSISFGNYSASVTGSSISVSNESLTSSSLFSTSIDVDSGTTGTMTVSWKYNGEYSGTSLGDITASDYVYT